MEKFTDSELLILEILWEKREMKASEIVKELMKITGLSSNTIYTVITRAVKKGILNRQDPNFICSTQYTREDVQKIELEAINSKLFNSNSFLLISSLLKHDENINKDELEEIKKMIDSYVAE